MKENDIYIIAEIGINHNGDVNIAKKLIDMAVECGCDAVKFQKRTINEVYRKEFLDSPRNSPWGTTQRDQKLGLEFETEEYDEINKYCKEVGIDWFASAWDINSQKFLEKYKLKYNKIASPMITNIPFIEYVAKEGRKTFISTGMTNIEDIDRAVSIFLSNNCPFVLMHCTSIYPCPIENWNLNMINTLKKRYNCEIGFSGHSPGIMDSIIACSLGAKYIEKHITLDRSMYGSDQASSLEKRGIELTATNCKMMSTMLGDGKPKFYDKEVENARKLRYWEKY